MEEADPKVVVVEMTMRSFFVFLRNWNNALSRYNICYKDRK
jgi:hypothetical protein